MFFFSWKIYFHAGSSFAFCSLCLLFSFWGITFRPPFLSLIRITTLCRLPKWVWCYEPFRSLLPPSWVLCFDLAVVQEGLLGRGGRGAPGSCSPRMCSEQSPPRFYQICSTSVERANSSPREGQELKTLIVKYYSQITSLFKWPRSAIANWLIVFSLFTGLSHF